MSLLSFFLLLPDTFLFFSFPVNCGNDSEIGRNRKSPGASCEKSANVWDLAVLVANWSNMDVPESSFESQFAVQC